VSSPAPARANPIATLFPGYFALVMATGIVAISAHLQDVDWLADTLYVVAVGAFVILFVLFVARLVFFTSRFVADLTSHAKGFAFLTIVAALNVLGAATVVIHQWWGLGRVMWWCSLPLWAVLLYTALASDILRHDKPALSAGINGTWFLLTVSTESIAVLGGLLLGHEESEALAFTCLAAFTLGLVLYLMVMTLVFMRWAFQPLEPSEVDPPSWIAAGAVAITALAGSNLLLAKGTSARIERVAPFLEGTVILAWTTSTFWFPMMIAFGVWRHLVHRVPLRYHPSFWSMVFPLGVYSVATFRMRAALELDQLEWLPKFVFGVALAAWTATFVGLLVQGLRAVRVRQPA